MTRTHTARRRFGQHFLDDSYFVDLIVGSMALARDDRVLEIGPGLGALTGPLLSRLDHLQVIEIDRDLVARLHAQHSPQRLTVVEGDALQIDLARFGPGLRVVGNLPYNISSPLLFHIAESAANIRDITVMLQKEVVDRMAAEPGGTDYGRLSVMLQWRFHVIQLFDVPPEAFVPPPKVVSSVVRLVPKTAAEITVRDATLFSRLVAAAFSQRRKTLRNTLRSFVSAAQLEAVGIDPGHRGEALGHDDFARLANSLTAGTLPRT